MINQFAEILSSRGLKIAVAESCSGGALSAALTSLSGSSGYFKASFITYSNQAKSQILGVNSDIIAKYGAVSEAVVRQMAAAVITKTAVDIAISISGIAGPSGGSATKPVGTVWFGFSVCGKKQQLKKHFFGSRAMIIKQSVDFALKNTIILLQN